MITNELIRTFIAIELPQEILDGLNSLMDSLKTCNVPSAKWVSPSSIHITLKFLGQTPLKLIPSITSSLNEISKKVPPFALSVSELGAFPNIRRVQVIWVGLTGDLNILNQLQLSIESSIAPLGYPTEKRPFKPHLTLGRLREFASQEDRQKLGTVLTNTPLNSTLNLRVEAINLIQSRLTPLGAIYTRLHTAKLKS